MEDGGGWRRMEDEDKEKDGGWRAWQQGVG